MFSCVEGFIPVMNSYTYICVGKKEREKKILRENIKY